MILDRIPRRPPKQGAPAPFIVGAPRSGTTLLRLMLDTHPELTIPPETHFLPKVIRVAKKEGATAQQVQKAIVRHRRWNDFELDADELARRLRRLRSLDAPAAIRTFYALYAEKHGKPRWGDKTPGYQVRMLKIAKELPEARFVHVIRDGRDVVLSQRSKAAMPTAFGTGAKRWRRRVKGTRRRARRLEHYLEVRYEDLVRDPEAELRRVCEFIELDFDPVMLRQHEGAAERLREIAKELPAAGGAHELDAETRIAAHDMAVKPTSGERVEAWRREMEAADLEAFEQEAGDLLEELGYPLANPQPARRPA